MKVQGPKVHGIVKLWESSSVSRQQYREQEVGDVGPSVPD